MAAQTPLADPNYGMGDDVYPLDVEEYGRPMCGEVVFRSEDAVRSPKGGY